MSVWDESKDPIRKKLIEIYKPIIIDMNEHQLRIALMALIEGKPISQAIDIAMSYK